MQMPITSMNKYDFSSMPEASLKILYHDLSRVLAIMTGHYQSMVFDPKADVFYVGSAIEEFRGIIKEASDEIDRREPKCAMAAPK